MNASNSTSGDGQPALGCDAPSEACGDIGASLEYAVRYYPSGTKQEAGSRLDRVVERHRTAVVREIVEHLRRTTGEDLGERPEDWIQKYAPR